MRAYAVVTTKEYLGTLVELEYPWVLSSFSGGAAPALLTHRPLLLLDSGAFVVWSKGRSIDLNEYIAWARELHESYPNEVALFNLDVIPGELNRTPTARERERAAAESAENAATIRAAGLPVIEVFHRFESMDVFEQILDRRQPGELVALGGLVGKSGGTAGKIEFVDAAFATLRDYNGGWKDLPPVHGLGVSADAPIAKRYPWFSLDSSTWMTARNFNLHVQSDGSFVPRNTETAPRTTKEMWSIFQERRLRAWLRSCDAMTRMWEQRGVSFAEVAGAVA